MTLIPTNSEKARIVITSLAHKDKVEFFPYDFEFDDNYKPDWGTYEAFGRMDPVMVYKRTSREININFNVVAETSMADSEDLGNPIFGDAEYNFNQLQKLIKFLYPVYDNPISQLEEIKEQKYNNLNLEYNDSVPVEQLTTLSEQTQKQVNSITAEQLELGSYGIKTIKKSPLITVSFMNLANNEQYVAAITGFKHKFKFDSGNTRFKDGKAIPGEFNINLGFKVIHTSIPGQFINYN